MRVFLLAFWLLSLGLAQSLPRILPNDQAVVDLIRSSERRVLLLTPMRMPSAMVDTTSPPFCTYRPGRLLAPVI